MLTSILILGSLAAVLVVIAYRSSGGWELPWRGVTTGMGLFAEVLPQLLIGFILAGLVTVLLPRDVLGKVVGEESGVLGIGLATVAGIATPGGPFLQFPLVAALLDGGAAPGPVAAYLTAWALLGWQRVLVWELPLLGPTFAFSRIAVTLVVPVLVGLLLPVVMRFFARST
jgi:uncharacterized membrane protein YraQ (UPF0718 family)